VTESTSDAAPGEASLAETPSVEFPEAAPVELPHRDSEIGQTALNLRKLVGNLEALPVEERAMLQDQARSLVENCPYSRAGVAAGFAMHHMFEERRELIRSMPGDDPLRHRIEDLAFGLEQHTAIHRTAGLEHLPAPTADSYLAHQADYLDPVPHGGGPATVPTVAGVQASLGDVVGLVDAMDPATHARIAVANDELKPMLGDLPFKEELILWRGELQTLEKDLLASSRSCEGDGRCVERQELAHEMGAAIAMLDDYISLYC
jgi:hypothetical protein